MPGGARSLAQCSSLRRRHRWLRFSSMELRRCSASRLRLRVFRAAILRYQPIGWRAAVPLLRECRPRPRIERRAPLRHPARSPAPAMSLPPTSPPSFPNMRAGSSRSGWRRATASSPGRCWCGWRMPAHAFRFGARRLPDGRQCWRLLQGLSNLRRRGRHLRAPSGWPGAMPCRCRRWRRRNGCRQGRKCRAAGTAGCQKSGA